VKLEEILFIAQQECGLVPDRPILAAVSGGPDSLFLLDSLWRLGYPLVVAHINHRLRAEADEEARLVQQAAARCNLPFVSTSEDVAGFAAARHLSIEEAARMLRYRFLFEQARRVGAQAVATGHTADDQIETVLMHWLRGSGLSGLRGMSFRSLPNPWSSDLPLVRPLLACWRFDILPALAEQGLQPTWDASNRDLQYYRNRLRHETLPYLETLAPGLGRRLWNLAQIAQDEDRVLEAQVEAAWQVCQVRQGAGWVALHCVALAQQPTAIQRRLLRRAIQQLRPGLRDIDFAAIEKVRRFASQPSQSKEANLAAGLRIALQAERLWLADWSTDLATAGEALSGLSWPQLLPGQVLHLPASGTLALNDGWVLEVRSLPGAPQHYSQASSNTDPYQAWLDGSALNAPLVVRGRRPGDRIAPLGMQGHSLKLSDFMINVRLPQAARPGWPLVLCGQQIAWIPGYRISHAFALNPATSPIIHLSLNRRAPGATTTPGALKEEKKHI